MKDDEWYENIEKELSSLKDKMSESDYKLFEVDLLLRVTKRVTSFSSDCKHYQEHRNDISNLVNNLGKSLKNEEEVTIYGRTFRRILTHLGKHHGLHSKVLNPTIPLAIGVPIFLIAVIIGLSAEDFGDPNLGIALICFIIGSIFLIVGTIIGIFRLFRKPI